MKNIVFLFFLSLPLMTMAQECDCTGKFNWVKKTFSENDAGFTLAIDRKGADTFEQHNQLFLGKVKEIKNHGECLQAIYGWLTFFRSGHIGLRNTGATTGGSENEQSDQEIIAQFKDWETMEVDIDAFKKYLSGKKTHNYEGIWKTGDYEVGIKKVGDQYLGFIIKADGVYWSKGQVKMKINKDLSVIYYMQNHASREFDAAKLLGNNFLKFDWINFERIFPIVETDEGTKRYLKAISAVDPYFEIIDDATVILRIPDFAGSEKAKINQMIADNRDKILSTKNLIIDLRNNNGGNDDSYYEILPLIYSDTIRIVAMEFLSTPLNNQRMLEIINNPDFGLDEKEKKEYQGYYDQLSKKMGEFVNIDGALIEKKSYDTIYPYPANVGILINENNASTTEQFLLAAKQSTKVKLFGTRTFGALDISNMHFVKSPCGDLELGYCLSKSLRIPKMAIDEVGIQPDYFINDQIPENKWIDFVLEILK